MFTEVSGGGFAKLGDLSLHLRGLLFFVPLCPCLTARYLHWSCIHLTAWLNSLHLYGLIAVDRSTSANDITSWHLSGVSGRSG